MDVIKLLHDSGAILKGHFLLSSGLHSDTYIQCARLLVYPKNADFIASNLIGLFSQIDCDLIVSPAIGGIIIGWEVARKLNLPFIFTERENGFMKLRRGFEIKEGSRVLIVEDVITTGGSTLETAEVVSNHGGEVVGLCAIVKRGDVNFAFPHHYLVRLDLKTYKSHECPLCRENTPIIKPGSRSI